VPEPTITCPKCKTEIPLTESLAAPLLDAERKKYERKLNQKDVEIEKREKAVHEQEQRLDAAKRKFDEEVAGEVAKKVKTERQRIAAEEATRARLASAADLEAKDREVNGLKEIIDEKDHKLDEAQKAQAEYVKKRRELDDRTRELELTVESRVTEQLAAVRTQARLEVEDSAKLKLAEKDEKIASMTRTIEELRRKSEQGSQQLQGEVQELELENLLRAQFRYDTIDPVPKGEHGGDVVQRVVSSAGVVAGTMLWECKRTKNFSEAWLPKLREDQRAASADIAILVTHALPDDMNHFGEREGIWVIHPRLIIPVAMILRNTLLQVSLARITKEGQQTKEAMLYEYLTGARFKQRVEAIVEAFMSMQDDLKKEQTVIKRQWAKRSEQIERVVGATVGMYGDLQGIAGKSIQEIEALELRALTDGSEDVHLASSADDPEIQTNGAGSE
jgi:hypothetical protein